MKTTATVALFVCLLVPLGLAQDGLELRVFDVEGPNRAVVDAEGQNWELALRQTYRQLDGLSRLNREEEERVFDAADRLVRMLRDAVAPLSWNLEGRFMRLDESGSSLLVRQTPENLDAIAKLITSYGESNGRAVRLELVLVNGDGQALVGMGSDRAMTSKRFEALRARSGTVLASMGVTARDGEQVMLRSGLVHHFLARQAAQIAQTAALTEPREAHVFEGAEVLVRPLIMADGRVNLRLRARMGSDFETKFVRSGAAGVGPLQLPSMRQRLFSSSVALSVGETAVLGVVGADDEKPRFLLLRVAGIEGKDRVHPGAKQALRAHRCGYLTAPFMDLPRISPGYLAGGPRLQDEPDDETRFGGEDRGFLRGDSLIDLVRMAVTPDFWIDNRYLLEFEGTRLWLAAGTDQHRELDALLRGLTRDRARFVDVEACMVAVDRAALEAARRDGGKDWLARLLESNEVRRLHTAFGSTELGGRIDFVEGLEHGWIPDCEADVAQGADQLEPSVETGFRGMILRLAPFTAGQGSVALDFDYELIGRPFEVQTIEGIAEARYELGMPSVGWAKGSGHAGIERGRYHLLAETASGVEGEPILLVLRLR